MGSLERGQESTASPFPERSWAPGLLMHVTAGHEVVDSGAVALTPGDDYPDFVIPLARAVAGGKGVRGGAICDMGGADHINIIRMGGRTVGSAVASDLVETLLASKFSQAERHPQTIAQETTHERPACSRTRRHHEAESRPRLHRVVLSAASL